MLRGIWVFILGIPGWFIRASWVKKVIIVLVILIAGFFIVKGIISGKTDGYVFDTVQRRSITEIVTESGTVTTNGRVNVYSPTNGVIQKILITNGEIVTQGQKLFSVESTATPEEVTAAYSAYQAANSAVQQAENTRRSTSATVDRVHDDLKNHGSDETFLQKETRTIAEVTNDSAYDALQAARAALVSAQTAYQATQNATVVAPVAGTISNLSVVAGSGVTINSLLTPTTPVLIIAGLGKTEIVVSVGESDINKIKTGQSVDIKLDASPDKTYKGLVTRFDENGSIIQNVVKFNVYIEITDADDKIKPGMTADVDITTNELTDVLSVPNTAVKPYQKGRAVRNLTSGGKLEFIPVKVGLRGKEFTQITEGLTEGQKIVVSLANEKTGSKGLFGL